MSANWCLHLLLLLTWTQLDSVLAERKLEESQTLIGRQLGRLSLRTSTNELHEEDSDNNHNEDDDYYNDDNDDDVDVDGEDDVNDDDDVFRGIPLKLSYTHSVISSSPSSSSSSPLSHSKRVPRHPQHFVNDNRLVISAAYHEASGYQLNQAPGVLTAQKQQEVGSPDMVQKSRRLYQEREIDSQNQTLIENLARKHVLSMENEVLCKYPQPRIIRMTTEPSKVYSPRVAKLHRCDENSSCCTNSLVWTVKNKTTVELAFWVWSLGSRHAEAKMVSLTNHTECHCVSPSAQRRKRSYQCQCPKHFTNFGRQASPFSRAGGVAVGPAASCRCDCHLSNTTCQRMKNGEEGFAVSELKCIRSNECSPPICNYGVFIHATGRCPRSMQQRTQLGFG